MYCIAEQAGGREWSGSVSTEVRAFPHDGLFPPQEDLYFSMSSTLEYDRELGGGRQRIFFKPFVRVDQHDDERTHADIRELLYTASYDAFDIHAGIGKVFWGVTEFYHLVDIINQTDFVENPVGDDKLGQPMISLATHRDWGALDLYILPYFRERTFPGDKGRFRLLSGLNADAARYESGDKQRHLDWSARWAYSAHGADIGISYFNGTRREPDFVLNIDTLPFIEPVPFYRQMEQLGIDLQAVTGNWLWKFEGIRRRETDRTYSAGTGGFEYSFIGAFDSRVDIGLVGEYMYDERGLHATHYYQRDIGAGVRVAMNDLHGSELLVGGVRDRDNGGTFWNIEASRRLGNHYRLSIEAAIFSDIAPDDILFWLRNDDYLSVEVFRYF